MNYIKEVAFGMYDNIEVNEECFLKVKVNEDANVLDLAINDLNVELDLSKLFNTGLNFDKCCKIFDNDSDLLLRRQNLKLNDLEEILKLEKSVEIVFREIDMMERRVEETLEQESEENIDIASQTLVDVINGMLYDIDVELEYEYCSVCGELLLAGYHYNEEASYCVECHNYSESIGKFDGDDDDDYTYSELNN